MSKIVYVHIGLPKTASSALQDSMMNAPEPLAEMGIRYVHAGTQSFHDFGHHVLVMHLLGERGQHIYRGLDQGEITRSWDAAMEEIATRPESYYFLSSELFAMEFVKHEDMELLKTALAGYQLRIVLLLRDPVAFLNSVYAQRVRDGYDGSIEHYTNQIWPLLNWKALVTRWGEVFGPENILPIRFERLSREQFADDVLRMIFGHGYEEQRLPVRQTNLSLPHCAIEFFQQVNRSTMSLENQIELRKTVARYMTAAPTGLARADFLTEDMKARLRAYCEWP